MKSQLLAFLISTLLFSFACTDGYNVDLQKIDRVESYASSYWGYNAPKIIRNHDGDLWTISMIGSHPECTTQLYKRAAGSSTWEKGFSVEGTYQPSQLLLDSEGRLNIITNAQYSSVKHYRSSDISNFFDFDLIASGNGQEEDRGWYIGTAIRDDIIYMSYITLDYDLWFTWKGVLDTTWAAAILLADGYSHPDGNHSEIYPKFQFGAQNGYIMSSHTSDGSIHNTYDAIVLTTFDLSDPAQFSKEIVFQGDSGYYSYGYDMLVAEDETIYIAHSAGKHSYGPIIENSIDPGLYLSSKSPGSSTWTLSQIHDEYGCITIGNASDGGLLALMIAGSWFDDNQMMLKHSRDGGQSWQVEIEDVLAGRNIKQEFFTQSLKSYSGSSVGPFQAVFSGMQPEKSADSLYVLDLYFLEIK